MDKEHVWEKCLELIRDNISRQSYKTWFKPLKAIEYTADEENPKLTIQVPSQFYYEWIEEHYFGLLRRTITEVLGKEGQLLYEVVVSQDDSNDDEGKKNTSFKIPSKPNTSQEVISKENELRTPLVSNAAEKANPIDQSFSQKMPSTEYRPATTNTPDTRPITNAFAIPGIQRNRIETGLNHNYVFERFIQGDNNSLAYSAAWAIAQEPAGTGYNPFLIYGGVGLGKTHLIQAIGNYALANKTAQSVLYVSSERFTNEFVQAIQKNRVSEFSTVYRNIDLLIVDDIQFFGGKEKTQEEFFHIFNVLHQSGKQIVLSSDRPPRDIQGIEERLLSRFQWGLIADVQAPDLETRTAILIRKAEEDGIDMAPEVIEFIAHNVKNNIRELEGSLIRLLAFSDLQKTEVDLPLAKEILRDIIREPHVQLSIDEIQRLVCSFFGMPEDLVREKTRKQEVVQVRQISMFFCKNLTNHSLKTIGLHFGGRDHSTVIHACQSVQNRIDTDMKFQEMVEDVRHRISLYTR